MSKRMLRPELQDFDQIGSGRVGHEANRHPHVKEEGKGHLEVGTTERSHRPVNSTVLIKCWVSFLLQVDMAFRAVTPVRGGFVRRSEDLSDLHVSRSVWRFGTWDPTSNLVKPTGLLKGPCRPLESIKQGSAGRIE